MENPFASPSGDPPRRGPDWEHPAYQQPGYPEEWRLPEDRRARTPRNLVTTCHVSGVAAWVFVICVWSFEAMFDGSFAGLMTFFLGGALLLFVLVGALLVAASTLAVAVPLAAVWWRRRDGRESYGEKAALAHLGVAWVFAGYYVVRWFV